MVSSHALWTGLVYSFSWDKDGPDLYSVLRDCLILTMSSSSMHTAHMPIMPFRGVLSSWEMLAMNRVLLSFAASAAFLLISSSRVLSATLSSSDVYCLSSSYNASSQVLPAMVCTNDLRVCPELIRSFSADILT